jgi:threonine dehydrogenase-like Zn-dependent dehydrogenase
VRSVVVGDRVAVNAVTPDGTCERGFASQCGGPLGGYRFTAQKDGNLAEYFHVNDADDNLAPILEDLPDEVAVYACDMLSTGFVGAETPTFR